MTKRRWLVLVGGLAVGVWVALKFLPLPITVSEGYEASGPPRNFPVSRVVKDDRPAFRLDPSKPWRIEFGRGSEWYGLDTIKLDQDGQAVFHRLRFEGEWEARVGHWETASARLPPDAVGKVLEAVEGGRLLGLDKAYLASVGGGTNWVLWVRQEGWEKVVYFDNHFPDPIVRFSEQLDEIVVGSVGPGLKWRAVPSARSRNHERELWESIKR